jgi:hypothetical protein
MKCLAIALPLAALGLASCDKAKLAVDAARSRIEGTKDPGAPRLPGGDVAQDLAPQVDSAAEGVRFRRDLPFPTRLEVRSIERITFHHARMISTSALGTEMATCDGTYEMVGLIQRDGTRLSLTIETEGLVADVKEGEKESGGKATPSSDMVVPDRPDVAGMKIDFEQSANGWRLPPSRGPVNFTHKVLEQDLQPILPDLLVRKAVMPRQQWFSSSRRWIGGDKIELQGDALALLFSEGASGKVTLTYEVSEAHEGHPCGRFAVQGDVTLKAAGNLDGSSFDSEMTIRSGKVWCSLLHPIVLREEYETVQTLIQGHGKGPRQRIQGAIDELRVLQWKP